MGQLFIWIIIGLILIFLSKAVTILLNNKKEEPSTTDINNKVYTKRNLMTQSEQLFYNKLRLIEPQYKVIPQINLSAIIDKTTDDNKHHYRTELFRNIDFGIFTNDLSNILLLIELNDETHNQSNRKKRDYKVHEICKSANIPIITFYTKYPNEQQYVVNRILTEINNNISNTSNNSQQVINNNINNQM